MNEKMMPGVTKRSEENWFRGMLDIITMVRSRKCPVCGGKVLVYSGDVTMAIYCEKCQRMIAPTILIADGYDKTSFLIEADMNGCWEV